MQPSDDWPDKIDTYFDGELTAEESDAFHAWLRADPEHIREFVRRAHLHNALRSEFKARASRAAKPFRLYQNAESSNRNWTRFKWGAAAAGVLLTILGAIFFRAATDPNLVVYSARIESISGPVFMTDPNSGDRQPVALGDYLFDKNGLEFEGASSVMLKYGDGTTLAFKTPHPISGSLGALRLNRNDELIINAAKAGKRITVSNGILNVNAASQPAIAPMIICTPMAEVTVLGTVFRLDVTPPSTRLDVTRGRVRIVRFADGATIDVSTGEYVVVDTAKHLQLKRAESDAAGAKN